MSQVEEVDDVEFRLIEKMFVYELVFNKEGQVMGGLFFVLVERFIIYELIFDVMFVLIFYFIFWFFCILIVFIQVFVECFDYVGESSIIVVLVCLCMYNVFKGWFELYWREEIDCEVFDLIKEFV